MDYEDFHIVAVKHTADRLADILRRARIRIQERVITEIGRPEYVIAVHRDDLARAKKVFSDDVGPGRVFNSDGT